MKHGHAPKRRQSPTYRTWASMITRCTNPHCRAWKWYGGRGISVCRRWLKFENFLADMGERPYGLSLDRKNNDRGYYKRNCRWASRIEQARNSAQVVWVTVDRKRRRLVEWCALLGISINTVRARVKRGWTYRDAVRLPRQAAPFQRVMP